MRDWIDRLEEIDQDCVHQYEYLLGRELKGYDEYHEIDGKVNEMILEYETREDFFEYYPELLQYANPVLIESLTGSLGENKPKEQQSEMLEIWGRLGISLSVSPAERDILFGNDEAAAHDLLVSLVQTDRCHMDGNTYFPYQDNGRPNNPKDDIDFEIDKTSLHPVATERTAEPLKVVYCLCEEHEDEMGFRNFEILAVSTDKECLQEQLQKIKDNDVYGLIKNNGLEDDYEDSFKTNYECGFVAYYIESNAVLSREDLKRSLGEEKKPSLAERIEEAEARTHDTNPSLNEPEGKDER